MTQRSRICRKWRRKEESEDEYSEDICKDLSEDMKKVKLYMEAHSEFSHNMGLMASYIMDIRPEVAVESDKLKRDAKEALEKSTKDEKVVGDKVATWKKNNRKWLLRPKKKEKSKERGESLKTDNKSGSMARWLEQGA